jgi:hypothetical protein
MRKKVIQNQDKYIVRLPEGMRDQIKDAAKEHGRTMNAEIVARLENFPIVQKTLIAKTRENVILADDKQRLEWELEQLEELRERFIEKDGSQKPALAIPQKLLDRIKGHAELNHRTVDAEAIAVLEVAFPLRAIDADELSIFLESLLGVSGPDGDKDYLDHVNEELAKAKQPWTVVTGSDGELRFYPIAPPSEKTKEGGS